MEIVGAEAEFAAEAAREWLAGRGRSEGKEGRGKAEVKPPDLGGCRGRKDGERTSSFDELPVAVQRRCVQLQLLRAGRSWRTMSWWNSFGLRRTGRLLSAGRRFRVRPRRAGLGRRQRRMQAAASIMKGMLGGQAGRRCHFAQFATARGWCICRPPSRRSSRRVRRRWSWRAGQGRWSSTGRESAGESVCGERLGGPKPGFDGSISTPTRSVRRSGCGTGDRATVFSRSAWPARSSCRTFSPIRRCRGTASPAHCGGHGEGGGVLGGGDADFGTVQAYRADDSPLAMALEAALIGQVAASDRPC